MKTLFFFILLFPISLLSFSQKKEIEVIQIDPGADEVVQFAASELQGYLYRMTDVNYPIAQDKIGSFRLQVSSDPELKWDGFKIVIDKSGVLFKSKLSRGVLYAVYEFLERQGCFFVYPNAGEEIVPKVKLRLEPEVILRNPKIEHRGFVPSNLTPENLEMGRAFYDWMAKNKFNLAYISEERLSDIEGPGHAIYWNKVATQLQPELTKRGFFMGMGEHCSHLFFSRSLYQTHPEWFALVDGKRIAHGQICYANADAVSYYVAALTRFIQESPQYGLLGVWPLDGGNYCTCQGCQDPYTIFNATAQVAESVKAVRPDVIVEHLAYKPSTWMPPKMEHLPDNMSVLWCPNPGKEFDKLAAQWVEKAKTAQGVYQLEYYMGDHYRTRANVYLRPDYSVEEANYAQRMGFRGVIPFAISVDAWWKYGFNGWFFSKGIWNETVSVDKELNRYCKAYYGEHAAEVYKRYDRIFSHLHPEPFLEPLNFKKLEEITPFLTEATAIVKSLDELLLNVKDKAIRRRVERIRLYVDFCRLHRLTMVERTPESIARLVKYTEANAEFSEVLMYSKYINHILSDKFYLLKLPE